MKNKNLVILSLGLIVVLFIAGAYFFKQTKTNKLGNLSDTNKAPFVRDNSVSFGNANAKITIIEFMDPQCGSCAAFHPIVEAVFKEYFQDTKIVYRYLANHQYSKYAIKILEAARLQGKYKEALEIIYKTQRAWANINNPQPELIWEYLETSSVNIKKLKEDFSTINIDKMLKTSREDAKALNVQGTPTIFVNTKELEQLSYKSLVKLVEDEIIKEGTK
ncbi:disulfide bond formation protein DsbA [Malaciobacter molluscorum LMG 25693]|uniref:Disulfide bond formation protein DsbA n=1 Tax=Malaciobacter molluscorum LMG 25693 TaxID=870501 RepID=A0A2G1DL65_9BACT|nr:thioredoxin domain-containing protein [Malaciobacter molluscorum]AXX92020.1 protein disulfide oxidoreductase, DsbA/G family [Malaciobacter molluscorum LMG 25693]PHO19252.1 disulfide bond formation protein DsbA [Malaciobacter molluscorum LMG 25693]RXJ96484.1 disulfide bond formation protein DsbA [Malaciobacter molluscorum]